MPDPEQIRGNTLRVYLEVLKHGPCDLRDVQRTLGLSTPSLASYHLGRLVRAGYVKQDERGRYLAAGDASTEILAGYLKIGTAIVPQLFFFSLLLTILVAFFSYEVLFNPAFTANLIAASIGAILVLWYETARVWRRLAG